jgi:hypothetical protein
MKGRWQTVGRLGKLATRDADGTPSGVRVPHGQAVRCAGLLERRDERAPGSGGYVQQVAVSVPGVPHQHGVGRGGDFYAFAAVGA